MNKNNKNGLDKGSFRKMNPLHGFKIAASAEQVTEIGVICDTVFFFFSCNKPQRTIFVLSHSVVSDFVTPWNIAFHAPLTIEFPGKNSGMNCHFLLQGIFLLQGSNPCLLHLVHWQTDSLLLCLSGSLRECKTLLVKSTLK